MKRAQLHNGEILEFPPETQDDVMDRAVREHLGLPPKVNLEEVATKNQEAGVRMLGMLTSALLELIPLLQAIAEKDVATPIVEKLDEMSAMLAKAAEPQPHDDTALIRGLEKISTDIMEASGKVESALLAPKMFITNNQGKPIGLRVGKE